MSEHFATIRWRRGEAAFTDRKYSRGHEWSFDGGAMVQASASPHNVPPPLAVESAVDPEEAFVASLSSCHMLWFLAIAAERGFRVDAYEDAACGILGRDAVGRSSITAVTLRPRVAFSGDRTPDDREIAAMHERAHEECFIANSVKTDVRCEWSRT